MNSVSSSIVEGYRLSPWQEQMWGSARAGRVEAAIEITGPLDTARLDAALTRVVARHEILRTVFRGLHAVEMPLQVILEPGEVTCEIDGSDSTGNHQQSIPTDSPDSSTPAVRFTLTRLDRDHHVLTIDARALCADAFSMRTLAHEIAQLYEGDEVRLDSDPLQYADFAHWHHEVLSAADDVADHAEPRADDDNIKIPGEVVATAGTPRIEAVSLDVRVPAACGVFDSDPDAFLLTCWQTVLCRMAEAASMPVSVRCDGRPPDQSAGAVGLYSTHAPLRLRYHADAPFADAVRSVAHMIRGVRIFAAGRRQPGAADNVAFDYTSMSGPLRAGGARFDLVRLSDTPRDSMLRLSAYHGVGQISLRLSYDARRFDPDAAVDLLEAVAAFAAGAARDSQRALSRIPLLSDRVRRKVLTGWNASGHCRPAAESLYESIERAAAARPDATAVDAGGVSVSFRELLARADRVARQLVEAGVGPDVRVAFLLERTVDAIAAIVGIWKAGGAYVPLEPRDPPARIATVLGRATAAVVVTTTHLRHLLQGDARPLLLVDRLPENDSLAPVPAARIRPDNLAYVLFTSGSTGEPKGVAITHRGVLGLAAALADRIYRDAAPGLRVSVHASFAFDASVKQIVQLLSGHTLCIPSAEEKSTPEAVIEWLRRTHVDVYDCTPTLLRLLLDAGLTGAGLDLRTVLVGGEAIDPALWAMLRAQETFEVFNVYGPTECTVDATCQRIGDSEHPTLGRPLPNVRTYVLDANGECLPPGMAGELCISGELVARGYVAGPAMTAARYVPDPFAASEGARMYCTGDRARFRADGTLEFLGRTDDQVKIRGYRIEPGEVEAILRRHPLVADCAVVLAGKAGEPHLRGYVAGRQIRFPHGIATHDLPNGAKVGHLNRHETEYLYRELFEQSCYFRHGITLPEHPVVLDIGANIGMFSLLVAWTRPAARIIAFEPLTQLFEILEANTAVHHVDAALYPFGCGAAAHEQTFTFYQGYSMMSGVAAYADRADDMRIIATYLRNHGYSAENRTDLAHLLEPRFAAREERCPIVRLSDVIRQQGIGGIDLLKIDVQRAEADVLDGIDDEDWPRIRQIVMEVHDARGGRTEGRCHAISTMLEARGYAVVVEQEAFLASTDRFMVYASRDLPFPRTLAPPPVRPPASTIDLGELREFLRAHLPDYMVPARLIAVAALPRSASGKLDRQMLAGLSAEEETRVVTSAPRDAIEEILIGLWETVLEKNGLGPEDNFFAAGGHSLSATQLVSRVRRVFAIDVPLSSIFEAPTPREFAARVHMQPQSEGRAIVPRSNRSAPVPISPAQEQIWFLHKLDPVLANCPGAIAIRGRFDVGTFDRALTAVLEKHEALRTRFTEGADGPVQVCVATPRTQTPVSDFRGLSQRTQDEHVRRVLRSVSRAPFDLGAAPLLRTHLLHTADHEYVLAFCMHHIVADGWSIKVLLRDLSAAYEAAAGGGEPRLAPLALQYADVASWHREWMQTAEMESQRAYWQRQLGGELPVLTLPMQLTARRASYEEETLPLSFSERVAKRLVEVSRTEHVTVFMTLLSVFQMLLARCSGETDIIAGTDSANRNRVETEELIGVFVNQLSLRTDLSGDPSFREVLGRVRRVTLEAQRHQDVPFQTLVQDLGVTRRGGVPPIFQAKLIFDSYGTPTLAIRDVQCSIRDELKGACPVNLMIAVQQEPDRFSGAIHYRRDLFRRDSVERFATDYMHWLECVLDDPALRISELPLAGADTAAIMAADVVERGEIERLLLTLGVSPLPANDQPL